ncbi:Lecithin:cholesterol acyltransferase (LCAT)/Acyl-ceramide synthase [Handroanthus impetiginosus]|uniref:Lecithin:cholesterol acyltransferase (LCAT)/Acyl-ceramide synthase n=1 Tax=Handroanthus impetiginosus TaxID=429701 RepID=A0A2G9H249_9LAMI|nr:Lecithin:cholesterol acyltransferase (LCAT)/Acyl-ceramide synthase [Handroanthus impetiginosus]
MKFHLVHIKMAILSVAMIFYTCSTSSTNGLHPLILIPGSGGNQLEARLTAEYKSTSFWCNRWYPLKKDPDGWFRIWFDSFVLLRPFTKCFSKRMMTYYDPDEDDYHNAPGVETRVPHFGSTEGLLYLDPSLKHITSYMEPLVRSLEEIGYISGKNLFGAPYDFRYALAAEGHPSKVGSKFLSDLKNLIESASSSNGDKPVILLSHSLGGLFALRLLNQSPTSWRRKYIKHFITLSAPWGGTVDEMLTFASGNTLGVPLVDPLMVREEQRSSASNLWLLPSPKVFNRTKPLVITPNRSYSSSDIAKFLQDIGFPEGVHPYKTRVLPLVESLPAPQVPVTCVFGSGVKTPETLFYKDFEKRPDVVFGDGDGTVNMISLLALESAWSGRKGQLLKVIKLPGVSHISVLKDKTSLGKITGEVSSINSESSRSLVHWF